jgi:hypothetical protein
MTMAMSEAQSLVLRMIELTAFNNLNGARVAEALRANQGLWHSCLFTRVGPLAFIGLRGLPENSLGFDTLAVLAVPGQQSRLQEVAAQWGPDELDWIGADEARRMLGGRHAVEAFGEDPDRVIMRVWWD